MLGDTGSLWWERMCSSRETHSKTSIGGHGLPIKSHFMLVPVYCCWRSFLVLSLLWWEVRCLVFFYSWSISVVGDGGMDICTKSKYVFSNIPWWKVKSIYNAFEKYHQMVLLKKVRWLLPLPPILIINIWKQGGCILCSLWTWQYLQVNESLKRSCWVLFLSHFLYIFCSKITNLHSLLVNQRLRTEFSTQLVTFI